MSGSESVATRAVLLTAAAATAVVAYVPPLTRLATSGPSYCALFRTTGLLCPVCGMTRATVALLHGHPAVAFALNPLVFVFVAFLGWNVWAATGGRRRRRDAAAKRGRSTAFVVLGASLVVAVGRNVV